MKTFSTNVGRRSNSVEGGRCEPQTPVDDSQPGEDACSSRQLISIRILQSPRFMVSDGPDSVATFATMAEAVGFCKNSIPGWMVIRTQLVEFGPWLEVDVTRFGFDCI